MGLRSYELSNNLRRDVVYMNTLIALDGSRNVFS